MSALITFPSSNSIAFQSANLKLVRKGTSLRSPFTGKRQTVNYPYAVWTFQGQLVKLSGLDAGLFRSFIAQLEGQANKFRLPIPGVAGPLSGYVGPAGLVNGASQTGSSLVTDGWTNSAAIFKDGDYFTVNDECKLVVGNVTASGTGTATISFKPALRASPGDNAALSIAPPTILLSLATDEHGWDLESPVLHNIQLDCIECIE